MTIKNRSVFEVAEKRCDECLFGPKKIVCNVRRKDVLETCTRDNTYFTCHKYTQVGYDACCHGFYQQNPQATPAMRMAAQLGLVRFIPLPEEKP
jgi:hypothetical protein